MTRRQLVLNHVSVFAVHDVHVSHLQTGFASLPTRLPSQLSSELPQRRYGAQDVQLLATGCESSARRTHGE